MSKFCKTCRLPGVPPRDSFNLLIHSVTLLILFCGKNKKKFVLFLISQTQIHIEDMNSRR